MSAIPETLEVSGVAFVRIESPDSVACWTADDDSRVVSIVIEPAAVPSDEVLDIAGAILADFESLAESAIEFLRENLREREYGLSSNEVKLLDAEHPPFGEPEAVVWADGTWMLRFTESGLGLAQDFGIGVNFVAAQPQSIDSFSDADSLNAGE